MKASKSSDLEIVLTKTFIAPREAVFAAITRPDRIRGWLGSTGMTLVECEVDLRVGGSLRYVFERPSGKRLAVLGTFESVDPPRGLAYRERYDFSPLEVSVATSLEAQGEKTLFRQTLRYASKEERDEDFAGVATSSNEAYAELERLLAAERGAQR